MRTTIAIVGLLAPTVWATQPDPRIVGEIYTKSFPDHRGVYHELSCTNQRHYQPFHVDAKCEEQNCHQPITNAVYYDMQDLSLWLAKGALKTATN
ncbi:hypothetical protein PCANC_11866 [Puccinia coronata f. sp. avenae]|uniref:Uncharacterized protein n=1 Tax=Puccinia coronata f. sp. avenae TaxID=200324 RepID=A0A2N5SV03_9BASI|nr:hypothetical protein PCANC_11866 [Puccinia coronata f. sp. avenae]